MDFIKLVLKEIQELVSKSGIGTSPVFLPCPTNDLYSILSVFSFLYYILNVEVKNCKNIFKVCYL